MMLEEVLDADATVTNFSKLTGFSFRFCYIDENGLPGRMGRDLVQSRNIGVQRLFDGFESS